MGAYALITLIAVSLIMGTLALSTDVHETHHRFRRQQADNSTNTTTTTNNETAVTNSSNLNETTTTTLSTTTPAATSTPTATSTTSNTASTSTTSTPTTTKTTTPTSITTTTLTTTTKTNTTTKTTTKVTTDAGEDPPVVLKKFACSSLKKNQLESCCKAPILDFFQRDQKLACNDHKNSAKLFSSTKDYFLHQLQDKKTNTIDFESTVFEKKFGQTACFVQCLFKNIKAFENGEIIEDALGAFLNENLSEEWSTTVTEAVATCSAGANEVEKKKIAMRKLRLTKECSMLPAMVMQCIIKNINTHCPESAKVVSTACTKTRASFAVCNEFAATEIDTSNAQHSKQAKVMIKIRGAVNFIKLNKAITKGKVVKSQSISSKTTPAKLINAA